MDFYLRRFGNIIDYDIRGGQIPLRLQPPVPCMRRSVQFVLDVSLSLDNGGMGVLYNHLMERIREAIDNDTFDAFRAEYSERLDQRI